jgi:hypothetical protein
MQRFIDLSLLPFCPRHFFSHYPIPLPLSLAPHPETDDILIHVNTILESYLFAIKFMREINFRFGSCHILLSLSVQYYQYLSGLFQYYKRSMDRACSLLLISSNNAVNLREFISQHFTQIDLDCGRCDDKSEKSEQFGNLPKWLKISKIDSNLKQNAKNQFYEALKLVPTLSNTPYKAKLLSQVVDNPLFTQHGAEWDAYFISQAQFSSFVPLITDQLIPPGDQYLTLTPISLIGMISKAKEQKLFTKYEIIFLSAISKVDFLTILAWVNPQKYFEQFCQNWCQKQQNNNNNQGKCDETNEQLNLLSHFDNQFTNPVLRTLYEANIIACSHFVTSITFPALLTMLGLTEIDFQKLPNNSQNNSQNFPLFTPQTSQIVTPYSIIFSTTTLPPQSTTNITTTVEEMVRTLILNKTFVSDSLFCQIDSVNNSINFHNTHNSPRPLHVEKKLGYTTDLLKEVYDMYQVGQEYATAQ